MELKHKLLEHPFYQSWSCGHISRDQLARYAGSYAEFIGEMPAYWGKIADGLGADARTVVAEETAHIALWEKWSARLPAAHDAPRMSELLDGLAGMTPSALLGAVHAFEIQQPGVAHTKKDGLIKHYGFSAEDTVYFDEHLNEQAHIEFGEKLARTKANAAEFKAGFEKGAELVYRSLDLFE